MKTDKYEIKWKYADVSQVVPNILFGTKITLCELFRDSYCFTGSSICHQNDNFDKDKGRRISLQRAMAKAGLSKEERKELWEEYRRMKPKGRW